MKRIGPSFLAIVTIFFLSSCAGSGAGPLGLGAVIGDRNLASAEPLFSENEEKCLDSADQLLSLIYGPDARDGELGASPCKQMRTTMRYIIGDGAGSPNLTPRYTDAQRNEIIDALIASSNRKCTRYLALLKNADGAMNSTLSIGAIISGGLGSFLGGAETAKALAGTSSILSGSRAAINESYLSNQTIQVLAAAFEKGRREQRKVITNRQACPIGQYTLMRGIEDALQYHNSCSLVFGLAETAKSIERSENPGLEVMRQSFADLANFKRQAAEFSSDGPVTPIRAAPAPVSVAKLVAADQTLTNAEGALVAAQATEGAKKIALDGAKASLAAQSSGCCSSERLRCGACRQGIETKRARSGRISARPRSSSAC